MPHNDLELYIGVSVNNSEKEGIQAQRWKIKTVKQRDTKCRV
jgi:hypothetical protein